MTEENQGILEKLRQPHAVIPTGELSQLSGVNASTLGTWRSRKDELQANVHYFEPEKQGSPVEWTLNGAIAVCQIKGDVPELLADLEAIAESQQEAVESAIEKASPQGLGGVLPVSDSSLAYVDKVAGRLAEKLQPTAVAMAIEQATVRKLAEQTFDPSSKEAREQLGEVLSQRLPFQVTADLLAV